MNQLLEPDAARQAEERLRGLVAGLALGSRLPPERELAVDLGLGRTVLRTVLMKLTAEGWLERRTYADADIACWLGWTTEEMWTSFAPHLPEPVWREASLRVRDEMERLRKEGRARLFPGVEEALDEVASRGATMVLLSNCSGSPGDGYRSSSGSFGGFSTGGGHK